MDLSGLDLSAVPRYELALLPTPLQAAPRLTAALNGPPIWIKRDDLTGFGFGGNKIRGLEFLLADALAQGADTIVTGAGPQSNHVRATAAGAARAGLEMVAIYFGSSSGRVEGNERLTTLLGARIQYTDDPERNSVDRRIEQVVAELQARGRRPYAIPRGGAAELGVLGYVAGARELAQQCDERGICPQAVVVATGSGGTHAGLVAGSKALNAPWQITGFTVSRPVVEARARVRQLAEAAVQRCALRVEIGEDDVLIHDGFIGAGYGVPTPAGATAISLAARTESIFLDPTYTGKAMAGMIAHVLAGSFAADAPIIFLHSGGEPILFAGDGNWLRP
ncbi:MAG: D-cysteine desulfhydrase [Herpetosiphon sp.]